MYLHVSVKCALTLSHFKHFNLLELVHYYSAHTVWHAQNSLFEFWMYTVPHAAPLTPFLLRPSIKIHFLAIAHLF